MNKQLTVEMARYDDLLPEYKESQPDNGAGKEYASYLVIKHNGNIISVESDAMEPEDARFYRDLSWIQGMLVRVYELGRNDGEVDG